MSRAFSGCTCCESHTKALDIRDKRGSWLNAGSHYVAIVSTIAISGTALDIVHSFDGIGSESLTKRGNNDAYRFTVKLSGYAGLCSV
jgi:hypothetical protein